MAHEVQDRVEAFVGAWFQGWGAIDRADILGSAGCDGDDATEFFETFAQEFDVDMGGFRDYFHYIGDEPPYYRRVKPVDRHGKAIPFIPVSLDLLTQAATAGLWAVDYPPHEVRIFPLSTILLATFILGPVVLWAISP